MRIHIPLILQGDDEDEESDQDPGLCGVWVDGCVETHEYGRLLCFDDSKTHWAFNYSSRDRIILILDLARPNDLPVGTATGGHSEELDKFIEQMGGQIE